MNSETFDTNGWQGWLASISILVGAAILGYMSWRYLCPILGRWAGRTHNKLDDVVSKSLCAPVSFALPLFAIQFVFAAIPYELPMESFIRHVMGAGFYVAIGWTLISLVQASGGFLVSRAERRNRPPSARRSIATRVRLLTRVVNLVVVAVIAAVVFMSIPAVRDLGASMLASAGLAGIIVGLAARSALTNLLAGIQVAITQPILIGDQVVVDGQFGVIEEIEASYVVLRVWDLKRLIIPISYFLENRFENWTFRESGQGLLGSALVYADYSVNVESVREELQSIVARSPRWNKKTAILQVTDSTEKAVQLRALVSADSADALWNLRCDVREGLIAKLNSDYHESLPRLRGEFQELNGGRTIAESGVRRA